MPAADSDQGEEPGDAPASGSLWSRATPHPDSPPDDEVAPPAPSKSLWSRGETAAAGAAKTAGVGPRTEAAGGRPSPPAPTARAGFSLPRRAPGAGIPGISGARVTPAAPGVGTGFPGGLSAPGVGGRPRLGLSARLSVPAPSDQAGPQLPTGLKERAAQIAAGLDLDHSADSVHDRTAKLMTQLKDLPASPPVALKVVELSTDPSSDASKLGSLVESDPAMTARTLRLANSAYFGLTRQVRSAQQAVVVLGLETVQSLAIATAAGLYEGPSPVPEGFWKHAAATASAAAEIATIVGASKAEAFSAGLLHDLGSAMLFRIDREVYHAVTLAAGSDAALLMELERMIFGVDHASAGADVLDAWNLPHEILDALRHHHLVDFAGATKLSMAVAAADALAGTLEGAPLIDRRADIDDLLVATGINPEALSTIAQKVIDGATRLAQAFG